MNTPETKAASAPARTPANQTRNDGKRLILSHPQRKTELPQFLRDLISAPPAHGSGVHQWLFKVARHLHPHRDAQTIVDLLTATVEGCGRGVPQKEIVDAVESARACAWKPSGTGGTVRVATTAPKWPKPDEGRIAALAESDPDALAKLRASSPVQVSEDIHDADCLLERLFPGNPLLCVADGVAGAVTLHRLALHGSAGRFSHIVPSPMSKRKGTNKEGRSSVRCLDNTGPRLYIITECDQGDRDTQAATIRHLATIAPLVMVVDSAGKSLHGWWHCKDVPDERLQRFYTTARLLGSDTATWSRCQLVRMPLGWRHEKNARQHVLFFNPENTETVKEKNS